MKNEKKRLAVIVFLLFLLTGCWSDIVLATLSRPNKTPHNIKLVSRVVVDGYFLSANTEIEEFVMTSDHLTWWHYEINNFDGKGKINSFYAYPLYLYREEDLTSGRGNRYILVDRELLKEYEREKPLRLIPFFYRVNDGNIIETGYPLRHPDFSIEQWRTRRQEWLAEHNIIEGRVIAEHLYERELELLTLYNPALDGLPPPEKILEYEMLSQEYADAIGHINESWEEYPVFERRYRSIARLGVHRRFFVISRYPVEVAALKYNVPPRDIYTRIEELGYQHTFTYRICSEIARELS